MIICKSCQHELPESSKFCGHCGAKLIAADSAVETPRDTVYDLPAIEAEATDVTSQSSQTEGQQTELEVEPPLEEEAISKVVEMKEDADLEALSVLQKQIAEGLKAAEQLRLLQAASSAEEPAGNQANEKETVLSKIQQNEAEERELSEAAELEAQRALQAQRELEMALAEAEKTKERLISEAQAVLEEAELAKAKALKAAEEAELSKTMALKAAEEARRLAEKKILEAERLADEAKRLAEEKIKSVKPSEIEARALESKSEPASEPKAKPASEPKSKPASEPKAKPASEPKSEPASEPKSEPASESKSEPASESKAKPALAVQPSTVRSLVVMGDDDDEFGEFDEESEHDFFGGRMSQVFTLDQAVSVTKQKGHKTTIVLASVLAVFVVALVLLIVFL